MEWTYEITAPDGGDPLPIIKAMLESYKEIAPCSVMVDSRHAGHVEFGTEPADPTPRYGKNEMSPVRKAFREWAARKFGLTDPAAIAKEGDRIYHAIMQNGLLPYPYLRPAAYDTLNELQNTGSTIADEAHVRGLVWEICEEVAKRAKEILVLNDNVYTGELVDSISVVDPRDMSSNSLVGTSFEQKLDDGVWQNPIGHKDGFRGPNPRYRRR